MKVYLPAIVKVEMRGRWYSIIAGGLAFWLPVVVVCAVFRDPGLLPLNILPILGLVALALIDRIGKQRAINWNWALAGIYILGPISILTASAFSGGHFPPLTDRSSGLFWALVCFFPPMTLMLSFYIFTILPLLVASVALPLVALVEHDWKLIDTR
jgi:hypothetical protein